LTRACAGRNANGRVNDMPALVITLVGAATAHFTQNAGGLARPFTASGTGPRLKIVERDVFTRIVPR